jgi:hypothetical protein
MPVIPGSLDLVAGDVGVDEERADEALVVGPGPDGQPAQPGMPVE